MDDREQSKPTPSVNPGYADLQLTKALVSVEQTADPEVRARAEERVRKWAQVLSNIVQGNVEYGSRKPLSDVPTWATPEVVTGGFVTGTLLAAGSLRPHETELLQLIGAPATASESRKALNLHFLSDAGFSALREKLASGRYDIEVPEEGALLVVTWLVMNGHGEPARAILEEIGGSFSQLRFYPVPTSADRSFGSDVFLRDVATVIQGLKKRRPNQRIDRQKESIEIWTPLYDEMISLVSASVVDGAPFKVIDSKWRDRVRNVLARIDSAAAAYPGCRKPHDKTGSFAQIRRILEKYLDAGLSDNEVKRADELLARYVAKRGTPGSDKQCSIRAAQRSQSCAPTFLDLTRIVIGRLERYPAKGGVSSIEPVVQPIEQAEATDSVPPQSKIPPTIVAKVRRCAVDSMANLVEAGVIPSADTLAEVLPQVTSGLRSLGIRDPQLRRLYAALYRAFRRRRSLLLLNLESQVRIEELPWVSAIERFREHDLSAHEVSKQALIDLVLLTLTSFPHAIVPNKMLQELRALAKGAQLELPLVDELAADIFMGQFSGKFVRAAKVAADLLDGTLYAKYFALDCEGLRHLPEEPTGSLWPFSRQKTDRFLELVCARAGVRPGGGDVAANGMLIEQQQVVTTQNLAVLVHALDLKDAIARTAAELSQRCFAWICRRLQANAAKTHDHLIAIKNSAYAWRQAIFFLSLADAREADRFLEWAEQHLSTQPDTFQQRLGPALSGLKWSVQSGAAPSRAPDEHGVQFLGWANHRHWLLPKQKPR